MYKLLRDTIFYFGTLVARSLPPWKEAQVMEVFPPIVSIPVSLPVNYSNLPNNFAIKFINSKTIPARRIFILKDVYVSGQAVVFKNLRIFLSSLTWLKDLDLYRQGKFLLRQWVGNVQYSETETIALVYDQWSAENYYHWIIESLPRILLVQEKYPQCIFIIPEPAPEFIRTTISLLGITKLVRLPVHPGSALKALKLVLPELVYYYEEEEYTRLLQEQKRIKTNKSRLSIELSNSPENHNEELITIVRSKLLSHYNNNPVTPKRKIFASRSRQKTRRLINEEEISPLLNKYGFELVYFEGMTFNEQVNLMRETAVFLGVHGANMVNILFMQSGTKVIEMMNQDYMNEAYYFLSSTIKLPYYSVPCTMADPAIILADDPVKLNDADLVVNITELEEVLNMCNHSILHFNN